jgi:site-specific DNA recombinase
VRFASSKKLTRSLVKKQKTFYKGRAVMVKNQNYKIGIYVRVSTEEQAENPDGSIRNQEHRLREAIEWRNKSSSFGELAGVYIDAGISAKNMNRPKLQEMLKDAKLGKINLIMVTELSRLSRNLMDFVSIWEMLKNHQCSFLSLREDFDTTTAMGEMVLFQSMTMAQYERKQVSERVHLNILARASRGLYNGGSIPLGYTKHPTNRASLAIDLEHAATIRVCFETYLKMGSLSSTARWLNDHEYKAKAHHEGGGNLMRLGHFTVDNVQKILRNKIYIGVKVYQHKGEWKEVKAIWDAIVDEVTFARVSELLTHNKTKLRVKSIGDRYPYILTGITFCKNCGNFMPGKSATGKTKKIPYYEHSWATKKDSCLSKKLFKCDPHRVPAQKLEPLVWGEFLKLLEDEKFILELREKVKSIHANDDVVKDGERLKSKLYGLNSQIESLAERLAILPKTISPGPIFKQMEKLELLKNETSTKLMNVKTIDLEQRLVPFETFSEFAGIVKMALTKDDDGTLRKKVLQKFVSRVEVGVDKVRIAWNVDRDHYNREIVYGGDLEKNAAGNLGQKESTPATAGVVPVFGKKKNLNFIWYGSSNSLTNGAQSETRTRTSC